MEKTKLAVLAVILELIKDDAFNDAWRAKSARQQDSIKRRIGAAIERELTHEPVTTPPVP